MNARELAAAGRPSVGQAARSPTALWNLLTSLLLVVSLLFPHRFAAASLRSRSAGEVVDPTAGQETAELWQCLLLWPYLFGLATFLVFAVLVVRRPRSAQPALVLLPLLMSGGLAAAWFALLFSGSFGARIAMWSAVLAAPLTAYVVMRAMSLYRNGRVLAAAAWGQSLLCILAVFTMRWLWFPAAEEFRWGSIVSVLAATLMMLASWTWEVRAEYDLTDRAAPHRTYQISIRQLVWAVALVAIGLTYWRLMER